MIPSFAQKRFAQKAKLIDVRYLSDYKKGAFDRCMGLLMDGPRQPALSVILVDKGDIICYIEVAPIVSSLSDMQKHELEHMNPCRNNRTEQEENEWQRMIKKKKNKSKNLWIR